MSTPLGDAFFSIFNRNSIQVDISKSVRSKTGYNTGTQNDSDLQALMGRVFTNMRADPYSNVRSQVSSMNKQVVLEATAAITTGILSQLAYLKDISSQPVPLASPVNTSTYGNKVSSYNPGF